jgi:hypothetical protein
MRPLLYCLILQIPHTTYIADELSCASWDSGQALKASLFNIANLQMRYIKYPSFELDI